MHVTSVPHQTCIDPCGRPIYPTSSKSPLIHSVQSTVHSTCHYITGLPILKTNSPSISTCYLCIQKRSTHEYRFFPRCQTAGGPEYILVWPCLPEHSYKNMSHYTPTLLKICAACLFASVFCLCLSPNLYVKFVPSYLCANLCMCLCLALHLCFYVSKIHACASIGLRIYISIFQHVYMRICLCLSVCVCVQALAST